MIEPRLMRFFLETWTKEDSAELRELNLHLCCFAGPENPRQPTRNRSINSVSFAIPFRLLRVLFTVKHVESDSDGADNLEAFATGTWKKDSYMHTKAKNGYGSFPRARLDPAYNPPSSSEVQWATSGRVSWGCVGALALGPLVWVWKLVYL